MQSTFLDEMRIEAMRFTLQSHERNVENSRCNEATDSFELNVGVSL